MTILLFVNSDQLWKGKEKINDFYYHCYILEILSKLILRQHINSTLKKIVPKAHKDINPVKY